VAGSVSDEAAFEQLYRSSRNALLGYFLRRVEDPADAADLLSEVFVVAWRRRADSQADPRLWLFGVARNVLAAHRRGRHVQASLAQRLREQVATQCEPSRGDLHVREVLAKLPARDREVIELMVYEGLTPTEIAAVLGKSAGTVRVRLHRARQRLQPMVAASDDDPRPVISGIPTGAR
jgi:RNA polymerase sigma-70 factor (ECF subfamily)